MEAQETMPNMSSTSTKAGAGFTLVELLVVAPVAILVIAALAALMINLVGDAVITQQRNDAAYQTQDGLDQIEQDIRLSATVLSTTGTLTSPQGSGQSTTAFVADAGTLDTNTALILSAYATTANPLLSTRALVFTNQPSGSCPTPYTSNDPLNYKIIYFVSGGTLWRRTVVPTATLCGGAVPWQKNSCLPGSTGALCITQDRRVVDNISSVTVTYYFETTNPTYTVSTAGSLSGTDNPTSVKLTIGTTKNIGNGSVTSSMSVYASRLND